jgi:neutral ceramidase
MTRFSGLFLAAVILTAADYKAGAARVVITPEKPIYMSGYAGRTHPSEGKVHDLWAKALAIQDSGGRRVVLVTTDLIGLPRVISEVVAARAAKDYGLERSQLVLNSSHTHTGPLVGANLQVLVELAPADAAVVHEYGLKLTDQLVELIGAALKNLEPATLSIGNGTGTFAINRRENRGGAMRLGVNPKGPSDHDVPVIQVTAGGKVVAVVFGYACHNTTLPGTFYQLAGDYAGYAEEALEKTIPGATALFVTLCGADQNPNPRGTLELARQHGESLAAEVKRVLDGPLSRVRGRIRSFYQIVDLDFAHHTREQFEELAKGTNVYKARNARIQLKAYEEGRPIRHYPYPVQAVAFGKSLTVVAMGGEVVVDYALRIKNEYGRGNLIVAGCSNDVMSYIPSLRVLKEGGYEAVDSMVYYGQPGPYAENVEERVMTTVASVMKRVGRKKGS